MASTDIQVTDFPLALPDSFTYKRNVKNGAVLNFQKESQVRFEPTNGSGECRDGGKISFRVADDKRFILLDQTMLKYRLVGLNSAGVEVYNTTAVHRLCQSGTDSAWRRQTLTMGGRIVEDIDRYNLFTAHENAIASYEQKQHLGIKEYYSSPDSDRSAVVAQNKAYTVTHSDLYFFKAKKAFPLCMVKGGFTLEMLAESTVSLVFPVPDVITNFKMVECELICQFVEPVKEYYEALLAKVQQGGSFPFAMQLLWHQEFNGIDARVQQLSVVTGEQTSVSSLMLVTTNDDPAATDIDKLNYSDDAGIRSISIQVGTDTYPQGKAISNGSSSYKIGSTTNAIALIDPEMYALSNKDRDPTNVENAPEIRDLEEWTQTGTGKKIKHWSWRQNFKIEPGMIGGGLQTLSDGRILINISQYPNPPNVVDFTVAGAPPTFKGKTFHVFWTTDHELQISASSVKLVPA